MGWCTTADLDRFLVTAGGYLRSTAVENTLLLSAAQAARPGLLFGWWEPPDGSGPRGAFLHDPALPLLIAGRAPEMAAALAGTLAKTGRPVCGVDGPIEAADAFAAAWGNRAGKSIRIHKHCSVYRFAGARAGADWAGGALPADPEFPAYPGPAGRLRVATRDDRALVIDWLMAFATEVGERIDSPREMADDLIGYGGAVLWESPQRTWRIREAAHHLAGSHHSDAQGDVAVRNAEPGYQPVAMAALAPPVAGTVRISVVYTLPDRRHNGHAAAVIFAVGRAVLDGTAPRAEPGAAPRDGAKAVLITDRNGLNRQAARLGYQFVGERAVLRFGPPSSTLPGLRAGLRAAGPMAPPPRRPAAWR